MMAMLTNAALVVFTSRSFEEMDTATKIMIFLAIEHAMIGGRFLVGQAFPQVPYKVKLLQMRQQVMVHRHFNLGGDEDDSETRNTAMLLNSGPAPHVYEQDDEDDDW